MTNNSEQYEAQQLAVLMEDLNKSYADAGFNNIKVKCSVDHLGNITFHIKGGVEPFFTTSCTQHPVGTKLSLDGVLEKTPVLYANNACEDRGLRTS